MNCLNLRGCSCSLPYPPSPFAMYQVFAPHHFSAYKLLSKYIASLLQAPKPSRQFCHVISFHFGTEVLY